MSHALGATLAFGYLSRKPLHRRFCWPLFALL
jgi:hypothetical protein